jgi:hypothetical protein
LEAAPLVHHSKFRGPCLSWVKRAGSTSPDTRGMSASHPITTELVRHNEPTRCANRRHSHCNSKALLFDHLVGGSEQRRRRSATPTRPMACSLRRVSGSMPAGPPSGLTSCVMMLISDHHRQRPRARRRWQRDWLCSRLKFREPTSCQCYSNHHHRYSNHHRRGLISHSKCEVAHTSLPVPSLKPMHAREKSDGQIDSRY